MPEILSGVKLTKQFPGVLAVDRLSFSLEKGEVLAFLGENGAGKSTPHEDVMRCAASDQRADFSGGKRS